MKMIDGDKLRKHLDYLIEKDNQFAKMCDGNDDYSRQRKYCFEVDVLAYELCKSVMDYYLVKDVQPVKRGEWDFQGYQLFKCTNCKEIFTQNQLEAMQNHIGQEEFPNFCPNCGARMDGDTNG